MPEIKSEANLSMNKMNLDLLSNARRYENNLGINEVKVIEFG